MARMKSWPIALLALYVASVEFSWAQEDVVVENEDDAKAADEVDPMDADEDSKSTSEGDKSASAGAATGETGGDASMASAQQYMDSAAELQEKLTLLQKLLDAKGENVDPELKEKMEGLKGSLSSLGFTMDGVKGSLEGEVQIPKELATACMAMSVHRAGARRLTTLEGLKRMANPDLKPEDAKNVEIIKMVAVCINEITELELEDVKAGKARPLPKVLANKAATAEGETQVLALSAGDWKVIRRAAKEISGSLSTGKGDGGSSLAAFGWLAAIPVGFAVLFLTKKFLDMSKDKEAAEEAKRAKAEKKKGK